jgi:hypothetical protein
LYDIASRFCQTGATSAGGEQKNAGHGVVLPKRLAVAL